MALKGCDVTIVYQGIIPFKDDNKYNHGVGQFSSHRQSVPGSILGTVDVKQMFFDQGFTHPNCSSSIKPFTISYQTQVLHVGNSCLHFAPKTIQPWIYMKWNVRHIFSTWSISMVADKCHCKRKLATRRDEFFFDCYKSTTTAAR